jgi:hypothetical protein
MVDVVEVKALESYRIWVRFSDGVEGVIDLSDLMGQGVFRELAEPKEFAKIRVDPESRTVAWPNGVDLCPDALYEDIKAQMKAA